MLLVLSWTIAATEADLSVWARLGGAALAVVQVLRNGGELSTPAGVVAGIGAVLAAQLAVAGALGWAVRVARPPALASALHQNSHFVTESSSMLLVYGAGAALISAVGHGRRRGCS